MEESKIYNNTEIKQKLENLDKDFLNKIIRLLHKHLDLDPSIDYTTLSSDEKFRYGIGIDADEEGCKEALVLLGDYMEEHPPCVTALLLRASACHGAKEYESGVNYSTLGLDLDPNNYKLFNSRGINLALLNKHEEALEDFKKALEIAPDATYLYNNMGTSYYILKRYDEALECYDKETNPLKQSYIYFVRKGMCKYVNKDYWGALEDWTSALAHTSDRAYVYSIRAGLYSLLEMPEEAIADLSSYIALDNTNPKMYRHRASEKKRIGDQEGALYDYHTALKLDPECAVSYFFRALLYHELKDDVKAIRDLRKAENLKDYRYVDTLFLLYRCYKALGKHAKAKKYYKRYRLLKVAEG